MALYRYICFISIAALLASCGNDAPDVTSTPASSSTRPAAKPVQLTPIIEGKLLFTRCKACHTLNEDGKNLIGPNLYGVIGSKAGSRSGFVYSKAMMNSGMTWDDATLSQYLANPAAFIPKNRMVFVGLRNERDRENVILYLKSETVPGFTIPQPSSDQTSSSESAPTGTQTESDAQ